MITPQQARAQLEKSLAAYGLNAWAAKLKPEWTLATTHAVKELVNKELAKEQEK